MKKEFKKRRIKLVEDSIKIFTCEHEHRVKSKSKFEKEGYPIYLCDECSKKVKEEDLK